LKEALEVHHATMNWGSKLIPNLEFQLILILKDFKDKIQPKIWYLRSKLIIQQILKKLVLKSSYGQELLYIVKEVLRMLMLLQLLLAHTLILLVILLKEVPPKL